MGNFVSISAGGVDGDPPEKLFFVKRNVHSVIRTRGALAVLRVRAARLKANDCYSSVQFCLLNVRDYRDQRSGHRVCSLRAFRAKNSNKLKKKEFTIRNKRFYALFFFFN